MGNNENRKTDPVVSFLALVFGTLMLVCSIYLVFLNNYTSATGTVGLTGGTIVTHNDNIWFELADVTNGGKYGLIFGIVVGLIANAYQFMALVIRDKDVFKDNPKYAFWVNFFDIVSRGLDIMTAFWYTTQGHNYFPNGFNMDAGEIGSAVAQLLFQLVIVVGFLTIGSEVFFAISLKLLFRYAEEGILAIIDMISGAYKLIIEIGNRMDDIGQTQMDRINKSSRNNEPRNDNRNSGRNIDNRQFQPPSPVKRGPGRPSKTRDEFPNLSDILNNIPREEMLRD